MPTDHNTNNVMGGGKEAASEDQFRDLHFILGCPGPLAGKSLPGMCLCCHSGIYWFHALSSGQHVLFMFVAS